MAECCLCNIVFRVSDPSPVAFKIEDEQALSFGLGTPVIISGDAPPYEGAYEVVPMLHTDQVLETNGKLMQDNVTVREIPVVQTTNPYGGQTVVIG